ncbi:DUF4139 domain-containing protein [Wenjunlia tyrosinilytica]|uniref:DUF4139 domain-containing protein n=1 Tax=Wenjunlia tyrosinilytica TaxID=1544741 RepID=A0A917ZPP7_9ACTN|nr:DUF4139 domain-containing protein [Wenjunlia tyrosinilytica]GGO87793.1 hypothetical protein GCM10012280_27080 [Wenjunlia tyrosinilytica]
MTVELVGGEGTDGVQDGELDGAVRADSVLESVVVHSSGAVCARRARATVPGPGAFQVRVGGLPLTVSEHSLRGRVLSGPRGLRVTGVRLEVSAALRPADRLPALQRKLEESRATRDALEDRRQRLVADIELMAAVRAVPPRPRRGDPPRRAPVEAILALADFVGDRLDLLHERLRTLEEELRRADHDVDLFARRLDDASSAQHSARASQECAAVLDFDGPAGAGEAQEAQEPSARVEFELEYQVPGAAWVPVYQLRLERGATADSSGGARPAGGVLVLRACVAQRTGEDWTGVRLGLSTADLMRRTRTPELRSLRIGRRQEEPATPGWREPPAGLEELFSGYDGAVAPRTVPVRPAAAGAMPPPSVPAAPAAMAPAAAGAPDGAGGAADWMESESSRGYGAAPPPSFAAVAAAAPPPAPGAAPLPPQARSLGRSGLPRTPSGAPNRPGGPAPQPGPAPAQPLTPADELLDYAGLVLAGPDEGTSRGRLRPRGTGTDPVVREYRGRAQSVSRLAKPAHAVEVRHSAGSFDYRYDTAAPVDVEADGVWHTVPVCEIPVETAWEYVCVPSVDQSVYGTVLLTNASGRALLAGPADITVDGDFVLTAPLPTLAPGQCRRVGVGVVESVQVVRRTRTHESTAGLRGGTVVLDHVIEVEVANRLPHPVVVEVRERVPVSDDKDVRIEETSANPPWSDPQEPHDDRYVRGSRLWRAQLPPGRTTTLTGGYRIRVPAGKAVVGGNRRG